MGLESVSPFLTFHVMRKDSRGRERGGCVFQKSALGFPNATQTSATQGGGQLEETQFLEPPFRWLLPDVAVASIEFDVMPPVVQKQVANITQKGCVVEDKLDVRPGWILSATGTDFFCTKSGFDSFKLNP